MLNDSQKSFLIDVANSSVPRSVQIMAQDLLDGRDPSGGLVTEEMQFAEVERQYYAHPDTIEYGLMDDEIDEFYD